ncbi:MAG: hypothetical protein HIU85_07285 [Proteobacteria bacterium]|nr:hypothetical protein [Pseudomonadota bacterium]
MTGTIAPVREIVIVIRDLYLEPELAAPPGTVAAARQLAAPGLEHLARFGEKRPVPQGWRAWAARWLGLPQYAAQAPASVAAAALENAPQERAVWLATPVYLVAGLTSLHFDRRSLLNLPGEELDALAASFRDTFRGSGFDLHPLGGGELLLSAPAAAQPATTTEPARMPLTTVAEALPCGEGARALRRLGAEIEMWLHGHAVNDARQRRGDLPVGTLWVWGGGAEPLTPAARQATADAAFGSDAYVRGLWRLAGDEARPMPVDWAAVIGEPRAQRALAVVEVAELLHANGSWRLAEAVAEMDRRLISPSLAALHRRELDRLVLLANDRSLSLRAADRWRLWRRKRTSLEGLA